MWEPDVGRADWLTSQADPETVAMLGPPGFPRYARVLHAFDPVGGPRQVNHLVVLEGRIDQISLALLLPILSEHTTTPEDCLFGLWDGWSMTPGAWAVLEVSAQRGWFGRRPRTRRIPDAGRDGVFPTKVLDGPRVRTGPSRDYMLFRGPITEAGRWPVNDVIPGVPWPLPNPQLMWPTDRAWFAATDPGRPWTGIGGSPELIAALVNSDSLDVLRTDYGPSQPYWRTDGIPTEDDL